MSLPYRTRRRLKALGIAVASLVMVFVIGWLGWVVYLERYIIYTRDGVVLDLDLESDRGQGLDRGPVSGLVSGLVSGQGQALLRDSLL